MAAFRRGLIGALLPVTSLFKSQHGPSIRRVLMGTMASGLLRAATQFPTSGFVRLGLSEKVEEEQLPRYNPQMFYPVYIGEVFASRYQVISKLGYGTSSTAWLCRNLQGYDYFTLKVCVQGQRPDREMNVSEHLRSAKDHAGKNLVRLVLDSFEIAGPSGEKHMCLIYQPLGMNFTEFQNLLPDNKFSKDLAQQRIQNNRILSQFEEEEMERPIARKVLDDRYIYNSRPMPLCTGLPVLSDLGEARVGKQKHKGGIMPGIYRAPEVILGMEWDCKVDIWSIGTMVWDLVEGSHLFFAKKDGVLDDEQHLAELVSLMGPPPLEFVKRSKKCLQFWDDNGNWKGSIPIPNQSLEMREREFSGNDKKLFLNFQRNISRWIPEERPSAEQLVYDEFLMEKYQPRE